MGRIIALLTAFALWLAQANAHAAGDLVLNVTLDYDQERDHVATQAVFNDLARHLTEALGRQVKLVMTQNAERVGERIRTDSYAMLLAPAQLIGLAMRHGYEPVARTGQGASVVVVARRGSGVRTLAQAKGRRLVLPHRESLVSYMVRGELNAQGLSPAGNFGQVAYMNTYGAVLYPMEIGQADLAEFFALLDRPLIIVCPDELVDIRLGRDRPFPVPCPQTLNIGVHVGQGFGDRGEANLGMVHFERGQQPEWDAGEHEALMVESCVNAKRFESREVTVGSERY